ncbi:MAG: hypothetical protein AAGG68_11685 [Bacteroidota bacterium]
MELEYPFFDFNAPHLLEAAKEDAQFLIQQREEMPQEIQHHHADTKTILRLLLHRYSISMRRAYDTAKISGSNGGKRRLKSRFAAIEEVQSMIFVPFYFIPTASFSSSSKAL